MNKQEPGGPDIAHRVFDRLLSPMSVGGVRRWDLASPYLLRHAAEHAEETGGLHRLFQDWEFMVHADPRSVLAFGVLPESEASARAMPVYQASLGRHIDAGPDARRHILAVDALRYRWPDISGRLYHPPHAAPVPWQCRWSTAGNISFALRATLTANDRPVRSVATGTLDGWSFAVTAGDDNVARVWDLATGTLHRELRGHTGPVTAMAVSGAPDHLVVTADEDGTLRQWDPATGEGLGEIPAHPGAVTGLLLDVVDGTRVAVTCGRDRTVRSWDLKTGKQRHLLADEKDLLGPMAIVSRAGHGPMVVIGGGRRKRGDVIGTDLTTGRQHYRLSVNSGPVVGVAPAYLNERPVLVITTREGIGYVMDPDGRKMRSWLSTRDGISSLCVINTGLESVAVTAGATGTIQVWAMDSGELLHSIDGHTGPVTAITWYVDESEGGPGPQKQDLETATYAQAPIARALLTSNRDSRSQLLAALSGHLLLSASTDETLRVWNLADARPLQTLTAHTGPVHAITVASIDSQPTAVSCGDDATARVWDLHERRARAGGAHHPRRVDAVAVARAGGRMLVATGCGDSRLRIFTASDGRTEGVYTTSSSAITALGLGMTPDGPTVVTATDDGRITARRTGTGEALWQRQGSGNPVTALAVGGSARRPAVVILRTNGQVFVHELATGRPRSGSLGWQPGAAAIATGRIREKPVAIAGYRRSGLVRVWDLASGASRRSFGTGTEGLRAIAFGTTPLGPLIASQHRSGRIRVWDADTGRQVCVVDDHDATAFVVGASHGRPVVVTAGAGGGVRFWDAESGELHTVVSLPEAVHALSMADGVLAVGYGRELAVFSASDTSGPWHEVVPQRSATPDTAEPEQERTASWNGRLSHLELMILAFMLQEQDGHALSELKDALCARFLRKHLKTALRSLHRNGLLQQFPDSHRYELSAEGLARIERVVRPVIIHRRHSTSGRCRYCSAQ
ncbi:hypothetical protein GTY78_06450 [Streptomyces sp. SID4934]|uniref:WD40 repeat domain-containing protein n=1 Tax=unclassified Streptomyces TaxID=2593676 RepID=UPI00081DFEF1|nr:WD40 repeat domain-containing protein [Streptomyces sp. ScaeMP-6W]MYQ70688.1 hypothetical protein [Streptomyces sp. SID4934]SCD56217.1 WD40 repeat [Streptomyces sp. ScaeMP-6W]